MTRKRIVDFKTPNPEKNCDDCGRSIRNVHRIRVTTTDPSHRYQSSNKPFIMNYILKLCGRHYRQTMRQLSKIHLG